MKNRILKYILIIISFLSFFLVYDVKSMLPLSTKVIVLDPGHGGEDPGSVIMGIKESEINLQIANYLKYYLQKNGANVIMTRNSDNDLSNPNAKRRKKSDFDNRIKIINNSSADLYISIHQNYLTSTKYKGAMVFYNNDNKKLANVVQSYLNEKNIGFKKESLIPNNTYMYKKLKKKGLLIECGFLSNYIDRNNLADEKYQKKIAQYITEAIIKYYN